MTQTAMEKLIELKGDKEYLALPYNHLFVEEIGKYKDHYYCITFHVISAWAGHRCGYVVLCDKESKISQAEAESFDVHGGITYFGGAFPIDLEDVSWKDEKWIGFDTAHAGDKGDEITTNNILRLFPEIQSSQDFIVSNSINKMFNNMPFGFKGEIRSKEYVIDQCKQLIDQIIEYGK